MTSAADLEPQHPAWQDYRRRRNSLILGLSLWIGLMILAALVPDSSVMGRYWWLPVPIIFVWIVIASARITFWHCPRCGELYFTRGIWFGNLFITRCYHCGLDKWADPSSVSRGA